MAMEKAKKATSTGSSSATSCMTLRDYYQLAQERIGQYDSYTYQFERWLLPIVTGCVLAAHYSSVAWPPIAVLGTMMVLMIALAEMAVTTRIRKFMDYASRLEDMMALQVEGENMVLTGGEWRFGHALTELKEADAKGRQGFRGWVSECIAFWKALKAAVLTPGAYIAHILAIAVIWTALPFVPGLPPEKVEGATTQQAVRGTAQIEGQQVIETSSAGSWISETTELARALMPLFLVVATVWATHRFGLTRDRKVREEKRKAELPGLLRGAREECIQLVTANARAKVMVEYYQRSLLLHEPEFPGMALLWERRNFSESRQYETESASAQAYGSLLRVLGEVAGVWRGDSVVESRVANAYKAIRDYNPNEFDFWEEKGQSSDEELTVWCNSAQNRAREYTESLIGSPVYALLEALESS